jgi:hypothetical protein
MNMFSGLCLDATNVGLSGNPVVNTCDENNSNQKWKFSHYPSD